MGRMHFYTFYILPSRHGLFVLRDLASSLTVLQVCTRGGNHNFGVGMGTLDKGNLSTRWPQPSVWYEVELTKANIRLQITSSGEGHGTPLQYSCLENPMDGGAW